MMICSASSAGRTSASTCCARPSPPAGIVLGVAVFVGMHTANQSVLFALLADHRSHRRKDPAADHGRRSRLRRGRARHGSGGGDGARGRAGDRSRRSNPNSRAQGNLLVLGVDMTGDRSLRDYDLEGGEEAVDRRSAHLPGAAGFADPVAASSPSGTGSTVGSQLPLRTAEGDEAFTVRGIMKPAGLASAFGGNLAIMDIYAAQKMFGRGRTFDRIDLAVKPGAPSPTAQRELAALLGSGLRSPAAVGARPAVRIDARRLHDDGEHLERCSRCSSGCSSSTTRSRSPSRSGGRRSASCGRSARRAGRSGGCSSVRARSSGSIGSIGGVGAGDADRARHRGRRSAALHRAASTASRSRPRRSRSARAARRRAWRSGSRRAWWPR